MAALLADVTKKVQEHEPGTLIYYAFQPQGKSEIVVVERSASSFQFASASMPGTVSPDLHRYKDQAAVQAHVKAPYFREFSAKMPELMAKPWELRAGGFLGGSRGVSRL